MSLHDVTRRNVTPLTQIGGFDLQLTTVPQGMDLLTVGISVFVQDRRLRGTSSLDAYVQTWRGRIQEIWDDRIAFESKSGDRVRVRFDLQLTNALGGCHFPVELLDGYAQSSGLKFPSALCDPFAGRPYLTLMDQDHLPYHEANAANIALGQVPPAPNPRTLALHAERERVVGAAPGGQAIFDVPMSLLGNVWSVDQSAHQALDAFCAALTNTPNWLVAPPILIHSESGLQHKADALADGLLQYLRGRGVTTKIATDAQRTRRHFKLPWTPSATTAVVRLEVEGLSEMFREWRSDYVVSSHEFGHLLGLPDEYLDYSGMSNATIKNSQPLWDAACTLAGVPLRNWHAQANESIMSLGRRVYPAHAATLWVALDVLTQQFPNNLPAASWRVISP